MNKSELITEVANNLGASKKVVNQVTNELFRTIIESLATLPDGEAEVCIKGFGSFYTRERSMRMGRNPSTGEAIKIQAAIVPVFKASKAMKEAVNG